MPRWIGIDNVVLCLTQGLIPGIFWTSQTMSGLSTTQMPCSAGCTWTPVKLHTIHRICMRFVPGPIYVLLKPVCASTCQKLECMQGLQQNFCRLWIRHGHYRSAEGSCEVLSCSMLMHCPMLGCSRDGGRSCHMSLASPLMASLTSHGGTPRSGMRY